MYNHQILETPPGLTGFETTPGFSPETVQPTSINDAGLIGGIFVRMDAGFGRNHACAWGPDGKIIVLDTLPGYTDSTLVQVREDGSISGYCHKADQSTGWNLVVKSLLWDQTGKIVQQAGDTIPPYVDASGFGITSVIPQVPMSSFTAFENGLLIGVANATGRFGQADAVVAKGGRIYSLPKPRGLSKAFPCGLNAAGMIVGYCVPGGFNFSRTCCLWDCSDLSNPKVDFLDANTAANVSFSDSAMVYAGDINNHGQICAYGLVDGALHPLLLTPA